MLRLKISSPFARRSFTLALLSSIFAFVGPTFASNVPSTLSLGGELFKADGSAVRQAGVNFKVQVYDAAESCLLYSEEHVGEDLSASGGHFNLILGAGTSAVNNVTGAAALDAAVFANAGATTVAGCGAVALAAGSPRQIHVLYDLGSGYVTLTPAVPVVASAYALVAETLAGHAATDFIQVNGTSALSQANEEYAFSLTNWPRLKALLDGTSSQYLPSSPTVPLDVNGQRITDLGNPTAAQDAATKHYVDTNLGGSALDLTAVGPMTGAGSTLLWDATANKWVAGTLSTTPTGAAGGDLNGTYPNPTIKNDAITAAKIKSTGVAVNRLIITDATTGASLGYGECTAVGQVYAWTATGWACTSAASLSSVTSVAGKTGAVSLNAADVAGLGTAALSDWGTAANQIVRLDGSARLPAVDGSQLANVNAVQLQGRAVAAVAPTSGQVLSWNASATRWEPTTGASGNVTGFTTGTGLLGGPITTTGTLSVDVGTAAGKIVQENANAQIAQSTGSPSAPAYAFAGNVNTGLYSPGANQLALVTNGTAALTVIANGYVGVGVTSPIAPVTIKPTTFGATLALTKSNNVTQDAIVSMIPPGSYTTSTPRFDLGAFADSVPYFKLRTLNGTSTIDALTVDGLGNVGLGTGVPQAALDVTAAGARSALIVPRDTTANRPGGVNGMLRYNTSSNAFEGFANGLWSTIAAGSAAGTITNIATGTALLGGPITTVGTLSVDVGTAANKVVQENANAQIAQSAGGAVNPSYSFAGNTGTGLYSPGANQIAVATNGTTVMSVAANGSVGIGTTAPAASLDVRNPINSTALRITSRYSASLEFAPTFGDGNAILNSINGTGFDFRSDNTPRVMISASGNVGVGTTNPSVALDLGQKTDAIRLPAGTTAQQPGTPANGMLRYNSTNNVFEGYANGLWSNISGGTAAGTVTNVATGTGLLGGPISTAGTLSVNVGTAALQIPQLNASAQVALSAGNAALPAYSFAGNANTGLFSPAAGSVALSSNGTAALTVAANAFVGLGTTAPASELEVTGTSTTPNFRVTKMGYGGMIRANYDNNKEFELVTAWNGSTAMQVTAGARVTSFPAKVMIGATGLWSSPPSAQLHVNGSVGIGTTAPTSLLTVSGGGFSLDNAQAIFLNTGADNNWRIGRASGAVAKAMNYGSTMDFLDSGLSVNGEGFVFGQNGGLSYLEINRSAVYVRTLVGIGTATPQAGLDIATVGTAASALIVPRDTTANRPAGVNGMLRYNSTNNVFEGYANGLWSNISSGTAAGMVTKVATGTGLLGGPITTAGTLSVDVGTAAGKIVQENANAQIAQTAGAATLPSYSFVGNTTTGLYSPGANQLALVTNGTAALSVAAGGSVGIGTTVPQAALDVSVVGTTSALLVPRDTTLNRPGGVNGMLRYNTTNDAFEGFVNGTWSTLTTATGGTSPWTTTGSDIYYTTGKVGVGTASPAAYVDSYAYDYTTAGDVYGVRGSISGRTPGNVYGVYGNATANGGTLGGAIGVGAYVGSGFGTYTNATGVDASVYASGSNMTNAYAGNFKVSAGSASTVTNAFGVNIQSPVDAGTNTFTNYYGLYINPSTVAATNFSLYSAGGTNYFGGKVGVGTGNPKAALDVNAVGTTSAIVVPRDTAANRPAPTNGMIRYNTDAQAMEAYVNGAWVQFAMQPVGSIANVMAAGPPVGSNVYVPSSTFCAGYSPNFGSCSNVTNGSWPANGTVTASNAACVSLPLSGVNGVVIDYGSNKTIGKIYASFQNDYNYMQLNVSFSTDNVVYTSSTNVSYSSSYNGRTIFASATLAPNQTARFVRLTNGASYTSSTDNTLCQFAASP